MVEVTCARSEGSASNRLSARARLRRPANRSLIDQANGPARSARGSIARKENHVRGDEAELFRRYGDWLVRVTRLRLQCSEALAEDACAHAWLQLCRTQPERSESLPGWLRVVALHEGFRLLRRAARELHAEEILRQEQREDGGGKPVPLEEIVEASVDVELAVEAREALRALAGLRWRRRRVLALRAAGYKYQEIAEMLGVTYTNVNRHVTEGRAELRQRRDAA